jgi:U2 small nuclear ribonucleoprotein A'
LTRLKTLLVSNNTIAKIDASIGLKLPSLKTLVLTNNDLKQLGDVPVLNFKRLESLVLLGNPVSKLLHYREYMISNLESLKYLDFQKVTAEERSVASIMFQGAKGTGLLDQIVKTTVAQPSGPSMEEIQKLKLALSQAKSLEEITILERQLQLQTGR